MSGVLRFTFSKPGSSTPFSKKTRNSCYMYIFRAGNLYWVFCCIFHYPGSSPADHYLVDSVIGSPDTYPLDSDSFGG